jgi:cGMP-dependent protein kinase
MPPTLTDDIDEEEEESKSEASNRNWGLVRSATANLAKKTAIGKSPRAAGLGEVLISPSYRGPADNRLYLASHKANREKDDSVKQLIRQGIKQNRFCKMLDGEDLDTIIEGMEYFSFEAGEHVVRQGHVGYYFFVTQDGAFEVSMDGKVVKELPSGTAFGAIALLYACPRTATVTAKVAGTVWGAECTVFREVLLANARKHQEENRSFLDSISLFDGLREDQKEMLNVFLETFPAGHRVVTEGEIATAMYFVKKGELSVFSGGSVDSAGCLQGGEKTSTLRPGDRFGEHAVIYNEHRKETVIADSECVLLCIGARHLHEVLGDDLGTCLERSFITSVLRKLPMISHLSLTQQNGLVQAIALKTLDADEPVVPQDNSEQQGMQLAIVIDGQISGSREGIAAIVSRGEWCGDDAFGQSAPDSVQRAASSKSRKGSLLTETLKGSACSSIGSMVAGPKGARVALLSTEALVSSLQAMGLQAIGGSDEALDYMRQVLCAKKVPIFRGLSEEQINSFVSSFVLKCYIKNGVVIKQGEVGSQFFIISKGSVNVMIDGKTVRTLGKNSCFGERALLFDEPRSASVEVGADDTELWCISKEAFSAIVSENMRQELEYKIRLQDTSVSMKLILHVRLIGAGAFGSVRLVEHKYTGLRYALKRIKKVDGEIPEDVTSETALLGEMDHPFILHLVKTFFTDSSIYILTELITGGQLHEQLRRMGVLTRKQAQFYVASTVLIFEYLHDKNIVYRDLKPENIMLDPQGYLKLVDFGLAKKMDTGKTYTLAGTLFYVAPEVIDGHGYTISVDLWSLGVMFYEFVCGCMPFGEGCVDDGEILASVLGDDLVFPPKYNDNAGKKLMQGLMDKNPATRLGAGLDGFTDIKNSKYFKVGQSGDLFNKIIGRELDAPVVPSDEQYSDLKALEAKISLSDADELGEA